MTANTDPDVEIVQAAQKGSGVAQTKLYERYIREIYAFCYRNVGNVQEAEDLAQDIFIAAFKSLPRFRFQSRFRTWLYQVSRHHIMDYWRRAYKTKNVSIDLFLNMDVLSEEMQLKEDADEESRDQGVKQDKVERILALLPESYRKVLECRFLLNYTLKETAREMDKTENNIKVIQYRAIRKATAVAEQIYGE